MNTLARRTARPYTSDAHAFLHSKCGWTSLLNVAIVLLFLTTSFSPLSIAEESRASHPDLVARLTSSGDSTADVVPLVGSVANEGNADANDARVELRADGPGGDTLLRAWTTPSLGPGESFDMTHDFHATPGQTRLTLSVESHDDNTANNVASIWTRRPYDDNNVSRSTLFESEGMPIDPDQAGVEWDLEEGTLTIAHDLTRGLDVLLDREWVESRHNAPVLENATYTVVNRGERSYYAIHVPPGPSRGYSFQSFVPQEGKAVFGRGSLESVLLDERPMNILFISLPHAVVASRTVTTPDGMREHAYWNVSNEVTLDLDDGNHEGQPLWFNASWLESLGIHHPVVQHDDGERVPVDRVGDSYVARPSHFSVVHVFDAGLESFETLNNQPASQAVWGYDGIWVASSSTDKIDETLVRDFIPPAAYTVTAKMHLWQPGVASAFYPLAIGNRAERSHPSPADENGARLSMGFLYKAGETQWSAPTLEAYSMLADGTKRILWTTQSAFDPEAQEDRLLRIRATETATFLELLATDGSVIKSQSAPNADLPLEYFDVIFVGTEEYRDASSSYPVVATIDNLAIETQRGNFVDTDFSTSTGWILDGSAVCCALGRLRLTSQASNLLGLATYDLPLGTSRFSAEFGYAIWPNGNGAEGLVFFFDKDTRYTPTGGSRLGFSDADDSTSDLHHGYGIEIDTYRNPETNDPVGAHIALVKDTTSQHLARTVDSAMHIAGLHTVSVDVLENKVNAYLDGKFLFQWTGPIDTTYRRLGFASTTGALANAHEIEFLRVSVPVPQPLLPDVAPTVPRDPTPAQNARGTAINSLNVEWAAGDLNADILDHTVLFGTTNPPTDVLCANLQSSSLLPRCTTGTLDWNTDYCWTVSTRDPSHTVQGPVWCFHTDQPPYVPSTPAPASGTTDVSAANAALRWNGGDPDGTFPAYTILVDTVDPPIRKGCTGYFAWATHAGCNPNGLAYLTTYYWRVQATDGIAAVLGPVWTFTTAANHAPNQPTPVNPEPGALRQPLELYMQAAGTDPDGTTPTQKIYFGATDPPTALQCTITVSSSQQCFTGTLERSTRYFWRVELTDGQLTTLGPVWDFTTGSPPYEPKEPRPYDDEENVPQDVSLEWVGGDPDGEVWYSVYLVDPSWPSTPICTNIKAENCSPGDYIYPGQEVLWQVIATDGVLSTPGPIWKFKTEPEPAPEPGPFSVCDSMSMQNRFGDAQDDVPIVDDLPDLGSIWPGDCIHGEPGPSSVSYQPQGPSPADGAIAVTPRMPSFSWAPKNVPAGSPSPVYKVLVDSRLACEGLTSTTCTIPGWLHFGQRYTWQVHVGSTAGPVWSFTTASCSNLWCPTQYEKLHFDYWDSMAEPGECESDSQEPPLESSCPNAGQIGDEIVPSLAPDAGPMDPTPIEDEALGPLYVQLDALGNGNRKCSSETSRNKACTLIFLHGIADGVKTPNYNNEWKDVAKKYFADRGYTQVVFLDYYGGACEASHTSIDSGSHENGAFSNEHIDGDGCDGAAVHSMDTDIRHFAYHIAWWIYNAYTVKGETVDVVGHSMGGLLIRYALTIVATPSHTAPGETAKWPPSLRVENVVTWGTPHDGTRWACAAYYSRTKPTSVRQLCSRSEVFKELKTNPHPNGADGDGTYWTAIGSNYDFVVVPTQSAVSIDADFKMVHFDRNNEFYGGERHCPVEKQYAHYDYHKDPSAAKDLCLAWAVRGDESNASDWTYWPYTNKGQHTVADAFSRSVV